MIFSDGNIYRRKIVEPEKLAETIISCLIEIIFPNPEAKEVVIPNEFALGYFKDGGMAMSFRGDGVSNNFFIECNKNPPGKGIVLEIIKKIYSFLESKLEIRIGEIKLIQSKGDEEIYTIDIGIHSLQ